MYKSLKKYKKWIMVIGGSFLMIAFLLPQSISTFSGDPTKRVIGTMDGTKLRANERLMYDQEFKALMQFVPTSLTLGSMAESGDHYMLLSKEAEAAGYVGGPGDGEAFATEDNAIGILLAADQFKSTGLDKKFFMQYLQFAYPQIMQSPDGRKQIEGMKGDGIRNYIASVVRSSGLTLEGFYQGVSRFMGIRRMTEGYENAARVSDRRSGAAAREAAEAVVLDFVVVPADRLISTLPEPTQDEITTHYEKYKAINASEGENGIGYRKPNRVKLEWLEINKAAVAKSIKLIEAHVREEWNKYNPTGTQEAFEKGRVAFEATLQNQYADDLIKIADSKFRELAAEAIKKLSADGKFRKLPEDWLVKRLPLEQLATGIAAGVKAETAVRDERERWQSPVEFPAPIIHEMSGWLSQQELQAEKGLNSGPSLQRGTARMSLAEAMFNVRELVPATTLVLQVGVMPVFERSVSDPIGNVFYPRVMAVRPEGEPESLDEVRVQVVKDIKRLKAFEMLKADVEKTTSIATTGGLDAVTAAYPPPTVAPVVPTIPPTEQPVPEAALTIQRNATVSKDAVRGGGGGPGIAAINTPEFRALVMGRFGSIDPFQPVEGQPAPARTVGLVLPKSLSAVFARITKVEPLTIERLRSTRDDAAIRAVTGPEIQSVASLGFPFTFEALKTRHNYKLFGASDDTDASTGK